jgi:proteasome lid subunit RPN8/RPN11
VNASALVAWLREPDTAAALAAHFVRTAPDEGCAIAVVGASGLRLVPAQNLADRLHAGDPEAFPRTARTAYALDTHVIVDEARRGYALVAIAHSHVEVGAYFSEEDRQGALTPDGTGPLWPGVFQLVVDIRGSAMRGWRLFAYDPGAADFVEVAREGG